MLKTWNKYRAGAKLTKRERRVVNVILKLRLSRQIARLLVMPLLTELSGLFCRVIVVVAAIKIVWSMY